MVHKLSWANRKMEKALEKRKNSQEHEAGVSQGPKELLKVVINKGILNGCLSDNIMRQCTSVNGNTFCLQTQTLGN